MRSASEKVAHAGAAQETGARTNAGVTGGLVIDLSASDQPPSADATRPGLPVLPPFTALIEIALFIVLPAALDYFVPAFPSLSGLQPHPFWLPVLLLSLQYGTVSGLLAAGCAIAASSILGLPDQEIGEDHFTYLLRVWSQPMLWLVAAIILGQFRMRQIERKQELARKVAELSMQRTAIADYATNLRERCERLEREIVGRRGQADGDLLVQLNALRTGQGDAAVRAFGGCLELAFGPCQASVSLRTDAGLRVIARHGWAADATWKQSFTVADPLSRAMLDGSGPVTVLRPGDEVKLGDQGLAAAPILAQGDGRVIGMLKLEAVAPSELGASLEARLTALTDLISPAVEAGQFTAAPAIGTPAAPLARAAQPGERPRLWRQIRWRRGQSAGVSPTRSSRAG